MALANTVPPQRERVWTVVGLIGHAELAMPEPFPPAEANEYAAVFQRELEATANDELEHWMALV